MHCIGVVIFYVSLSMFMPALVRYCDFLWHFRWYPLFRYHALHQSVMHVCMMP
ncbi:hypothetical protein BDV32DRAFT_28667 [Aspergillus pseudonomiae]|nr:hypothetical protein BDV32DRAFT_28667 [Aspergillus pseudonomiae]